MRGRREPVFGEAGPDSTTADFGLYFGRPDVVPVLGRRVAGLEGSVPNSDVPDSESLELPLDTRLRWVTVFVSDGAGPF
jgi:hypothetical protein